MKMRKILTASFFLIASIQVMAQDPLVLSLDEARNYAVENNRNFKKTQNAVREALYTKREAISAYIPQADASINYNNYLGAQMSMPGVPTKINFNNTSTLTLAASQVLFNGNAVVGILLGKLGEKMAEVNQENERLMLRNQVSQSYYAVLMSAKSKGILEQNLTNIKDVFEKTQAMAIAGALEQTDADQLQVQVNMIENMIENIGQNYELALNVLKIELGMDINTPLQLSNTMDEIIDNLKAGEVLLKPYYLEEDPAYKLTQTSQKMAEKQHLMSMMNAMPTISAFYNYNEKILTAAFDMSPKNIIGLQASVPIFKGLKNTNTFRKTKIGKQNAEMDMDLVTDQLLTAEKQLRYNLNSALKQYETQKLNVDVAYRVFKSIELKYQQGVKSSLDLTTANTNYLQAETDYLSAMMKVLEATSNLEKLLGII